jgi:beta-phosphoglucomutase-like phosphatase (HAD superfamily)
MVLGLHGPGRVGRRRFFHHEPPIGRLGVFNRAGALFQRRSAGVLDGAWSVVAALDAIAAPTCVASSSSHERLRHTLGPTGLLERFDRRIFSAEEVANGEPAPDLFRHAATTLGADPARCAVIEDSRDGVEAARAAGMRAFACGGGVMPPDRLRGPATSVFHALSELSGLLA